MFLFLTLLHESKESNMVNKILIIVIFTLLSGCVIEGEVFPWYDMEGNSGVTNEIKL